MLVVRVPLFSLTAIVAACGASSAQPCLETRDCPVQQQCFIVDGAGICRATPPRRGDPDDVPASEGEGEGEGEGDVPLVVRRGVVTGAAAVSRGGAFTIVGALRSTTSSSSGGAFTVTSASP